MAHIPPVEWQGWVPKRYILVAMGGLAIFNAYAMRSAMSVAITEMAEARKPNATVAEMDYCQTVEDTDGHVGFLNVDRSEFDWDEETQGQLLSGLFWGYVAMNIPSGLLADRFGGRRLLFFGILVASVATMLIPLAARRGGPVWVTVARFVEGAGESGTYPGSNNLLAHWAPQQERSAMASIIFAGNLLGQVVGTALSGVIIAATGDWDSVFYVFGSLGLVWCAAFWFLCFDTPAAHPRISAREREYIEHSILAVSTKRPTHIPWVAILTSFPVWALVVGQLGHDWALFLLGTELPKYMKSVLGYNVAENGLISALPNLVTWICAFLSGWVSDWLIRTERMSIATHRKVFTTFATFTPGVGLLAATYAGCDRPLVVALFCLGMACMGPFYCSLKVNALDISPNFSGLVMSIVNGLGAVSGIVSPDIVGLLIPDRTLKQWRDVFWVTFGVCLGSSLFYGAFSAAEVQPWNSVDEEGEGEAAYDADGKEKKKSLTTDVITVKV